MITLKANGRRATAIASDPVTTGSVGLPVRVRLSADYDGLEAIVVFDCGGRCADVPLLGDDEVVVPPQLLRHAGNRLRVGVYATDESGEVVIPTVWADAGAVYEGVEPSGFDPAPPVPSWAAQVQGAAREALEAAEAVRDAEALALRVTSLDPGTVVPGPTVDVTGVPTYVADVSAYSEWGIEEPGWYAFVRIAAPYGGTPVGVTGAAGYLLGIDHVDVAVRFEVAARSCEVAIDWGVRTELVTLRATDLAIRNLDYRTTFYIYDIDEFATWDYKPCEDAAYATGKAYFTLVDGAYSPVELGGEVLVGDHVPMYYEREHSYALTEDATFQAGKAYYVVVDHEYVPATVEAGAEVAPDTYYERTTSYALTEDATFAEGKTYYERTTATEYAAAEVAPGDYVPPRTYVHARLTLAGMVRNVTYKLDTLVDCPIEVVLPDVPDDGYGAWYEIQMRYGSTYSMTLTPPDDGVRAATDATPAQSAGINIIDLHYADVSGLRVWRMVNTHSSVPSVGYESIEFASPPSRTEYEVGEALDLAGARVVATMADGSKRNVTASCTFAPASGTALTAEVDTLTASYALVVGSLTATVPLTVTAAATDEEGGEQP